MRFGIYTVIGCIPWTVALAAVGYAVGANWQTVVNGFHGPTYIVAAVVLIALVIAVWRYVRRRKAESRAEDSASGRHRATLYREDARDGADSR